MNDNLDMSVAQWRPRLIQLTQIANPQFGGGQPTACFVDSLCIEQIFKDIFAYGQVVPGAEKQTYHPLQECTLLIMHSGRGMRVIESPEQVALARDRALGFGPAIKAAE